MPMNQVPQNFEIPKGFEYLNQWIGQFLTHFPQWSRNVFVMMPFTTDKTRSIYESVKKTVEGHGLIPLRADQRQCAPDLWWNVLTYMIGSSYGVVIYEPKDGIPFNPNVSIEAGFMLALDRPVLFLANENLGSLPVDFAGKIYRAFDEKNLAISVRAAVSDWIEHDISYFDYGDKKLIVFVSLGGTCRCVMAKAILSDRLEKLKISGVAVEAAAIADPHHIDISPSAVRALREIGCEKWIVHHRPRKLSKYLEDRADLIVAMTDSVLARAPERRANVKTDLEVLGRKITNPYPDTNDDESLKKYRACRVEIENAIDSNITSLLSLAGARPQI